MVAKLHSFLGIRTTKETLQFCVVSIVSHNPCYTGKASTMWPRFVSFMSANALFGGVIGAFLALSLVVGATMAERASMVNHEVSMKAEDAVVIAERQLALAEAALVEADEALEAALEAALAGSEPVGLEAAHQAATRASWRRDDAVWSANAVRALAHVATR